MENTAQDNQEIFSCFQKSTVDPEKSKPEHAFKDSLTNQLVNLNLNESGDASGVCSLLTAHLSGMPPRRRRRSPSEEEVKMKRARVYNPSARKDYSLQDPVCAFSSKRCIAWFHEYTDPDEDTLGPEGMEKFCEDIGVEPENIVMLALAWKLDARNMGFFTLSEWLKGMTELQSDCVNKVQGKLDYLRSCLNDPIQFKNIYRYAFDFAREKDQRSMDIETAKAMLSLVLGKNWPLYGQFHQFLEQSKYKVINKDQWCNILEFSRTIHADLSNYDEDGAWPVLLDEFVDWYREQSKMAA